MKGNFAWLGRVALTVLAVVAAVGVGRELWVYYMESPWTRDGRVRADVVQVAPDVFDRHGYLAGEDARRAAELNAAIDDDQADAIIAARGGYGATRLLAHFDVARITRRPKLLVGFSDITALHALWARAGLGSLHAPMIAALGRSSDALSALDGNPPIGLIAFDCIARRGVLGGSGVEDEVARIGEHASGVGLVRYRLHDS